MRHQRHVLVVDDDLDVLYYVDDLLQELGYRPIKATSADDAAEIVSAMRPDAVVLGFGMIGSASLAVIEQLAEMHSYTPLLIMADPGIRPDGVPSPLRCFVEHPPDIRELEAALNACVRTPSFRSTR